MDAGGDDDYTGSGCGSGGIWEDPGYICIRGSVN